MILFTGKSQASFFCQVVMKEGQNAEEGETIALQLMEHLGVEKDDLIVGAYMDLLQKKGMKC